MANDWFDYVNPDKDWIKTVAQVPGLKWSFNAKRDVVSVGWHISHAPLMPKSIAPDPYFAALSSAESALDAAEARGIVPRNYQINDLPWLLGKRASILGYEMRLGKTALATVAHNPTNGPLIVVAPLIARDVWKQWIMRVHGFAPVLVEGTKSIALENFPAYFVHYDILDSHVGWLPPAATLVFDECHMLQARRSKRMSAASIVASKAQRVIGLSGTPMWSNPRSMWPILNLLMPGAWGSEFEFCQRYMHATQSRYGWQYNGINNEEELRKRLEMVLIRRTWESVLGQLPQVTNVVEAVELSPSDSAGIDSVAQHLILSNAAAEKDGVAIGYHSMLRRLYGLAKVTRAIELANQAMKDGHKVVLWHWHNEVGAALQKPFDPIGYNADDRNDYRIRAEDNQAVREMRIRLFNEHQGPAVFIAPLAVAGVGIDLSCADLNIFVEEDWIPATNYQAAMRIFKPNRPHANVWLFADTPIERRLVEVLACNEACQTSAGLGYTEIARRILEGA